TEYPGSPAPRKRRRLREATQSSGRLRSEQFPYSNLLPLQSCGPSAYGREPVGWYLWGFRPWWVLAPCLAAWGSSGLARTAGVRCGKWANTKDSKDTKASFVFFAVFVLGLLPLCEVARSSAAIGLALVQGGSGLSLSFEFGSQVHSRAWSPGGWIYTKDSKDTKEFRKSLCGLRVLRVRHISSAPGFSTRWHVLLS